MTSVISKGKGLSQKQLWIALVISYLAVIVLSDIYASTVLESAAFQSICGVGNSLCQQIQFWGVPYLFLIPSFYFAIQLVRSSQGIAKTISWLNLAGLILLLPFFWLVFSAIVIGSGLAERGGL